MRPRRNHSVVALAVSILTGCTMINFQEVRPVPSLKDYARATCVELAAEKQRIEAAFRPLIKNHQHGTIQSVAILKGEAIAVDASSHEKGCTLAPVVIPYNKPLHVPD